MTNGVQKSRLYSRIALEKDFFRRFSVNWEFRVTGIGTRRALHQG